MFSSPPRQPTHSSFPGRCPRVYPGSSRASLHLGSPVGSSWGLGAMFLTVSRPQLWKLPKWFFHRDLFRPPRRKGPALPSATVISCNSACRQRQRQHQEDGHGDWALWGMQSRPVSHMELKTAAPRQPGRSAVGHPCTPCMWHVTPSAPLAHPSRAQERLL
jgi:hypothetical protein